MKTTQAAGGGDRERFWQIYQKPDCTSTGVDTGKDRLLFMSNNQTAGLAGAPGLFPFFVEDISGIPPAVGYGLRKNYPLARQGLVTDANYKLTPQTNDVSANLCFWGEMGDEV